LIDTQRIDITNFERGKTNLITSVCKHLGVESTSQRREREAGEAARLQAEQQERERLAREQVEKQRQAELAEQKRQAREEAERKRRIQAHQPREATTPASPIAQNPTASGIAQTTVRKLTPWNPLDQWRLLWWLFMNPANYVNYETQVGEITLRKTGAWLASTLTWLLFLIPIMAATLGITPSITRLSSSWNWWAIALPVIWLLAAALGQSINSDIVGVILGGAAGGLAGIVMIGLAGSTTGIYGYAITLGVAGIVASGMAYGVASSTSGSMAATMLNAALLMMILTSGITDRGTMVDESDSAAVSFADTAVLFLGVGVMYGVVYIEMYIIAFGVAYVVAYIVARGEAWRAARKVAQGVGRWVAFNLMGIVVYVVARVVKNNIEHGQSSVWSKIIFAALILSYAALIWIYWLGGWRVLSGA
jgi:hypothetical protein